MGETALIIFFFEGTQRVANAREVEGEFDRMFRVVMDDGYENNFFTTPDQPYTWYEQTIGYTDLAQAVGRAIERTFY